MLCRSTAQQQAECPWVTSPCTLLFLLLPLPPSFFFLSSHGCQYLPWPTKSFMKNIIHASDFTALQVSLLFSAMFWCLQVHSLRAHAAASYLRCSSRVKWKRGWPRLDPNNYLGHVCVPYATITRSASWDYMRAACAHTCTHTNTDMRFNKLVHATAEQSRAEQSISVH